MISEIERLKRRVEDQQALMAQERRRKKLRPNVLMEKDTPDTMTSYDFWCETCQLDFSAACYKTWHRLEGDWIAVWRANCPICATACIRHITHKDEDLYYQRSTKIRRQRNQYAWEVLQADEYGFRTHYGNPYTEFDEKMIRAEQRIIKAEKARGFRGLSLEAQEKLRRLIKADGY